MKMEMKAKVHRYVRNCWDSYRCADKKEIERIIDEVLQEYPDETNHVKLGVIVKRRCIGEL